MMKLFISMMFVSSLAQAIPCELLLNQFNEAINESNYSSMQIEKKYKGGTLIFTPALTSNKLRISFQNREFDRPKVLEISHRDNLIGVLSKDKTELVVITRVGNDLFALDLLRGNEPLLIKDQSTLSRIRGLFANNSRKNSASQITTNPDTSEERGRGHWYDQDDLDARPYRNNGMGTTLARPQSDLDLSDFPDRR